MKQIHIVQDRALSDEESIVFEDAMTVGYPGYPILDQRFINERILSLGISEDSYYDSMEPLLHFADHVNAYDEVNLIFADSAEGKSDLTMMLALLEQNHYKGRVNAVLVNAEERKQFNNLVLGPYTSIYQTYIKNRRNERRS